MTPTTVLIALAVGVLTTAVAALSPGPARDPGRAARGAASRPPAARPTASVQRSRRRTVIASILIVAGVAAARRSACSAPATSRTALPLLGLGLVLLFIGLAMVGDRFVGPLASALGWPIERLRGVTGRLARENAQRQPARTATTAAALMIGVALVVFVGVFASSIRESINDTLDRQFAGDLAIVNTDGFSPIPARVADDVASARRRRRRLADDSAADPGRARRRRVVRQRDRARRRSARSPRSTGPRAPTPPSTELADDEAVIDENFAEKQGVDVGDELEVTGPSGDEVTVDGRGDHAPTAGSSSTRSR